MAVRSTPRRPATYADIESAPPHMVAEIIAGELYTSPRPAVPHARAASRLIAKLSGPFDLGDGGPGGWVILVEPELHFGAEPEVLVPDLAGWRRERMPEIPLDASISLAPDWVCEILSKSTEAVDRAEKMPVYAREGVAHLWLADPLAQTIEIFRLESGRWVLLAAHRGAVTVRVEPFEAVPLDLAAIWAR